MLSGRTLFDDMRKKIDDYPELRTLLSGILFNGLHVPYNRYNAVIDMGTMFGFIRNENGKLNMDLVLEKFVIHFSELYAGADEKFLEENGRRFFLLYLKPIINGTGNHYYIESRIRDMRRTDVIVDYRGQQFIIELKIWRGGEYNKRGDQQLGDYLEGYHQKKGYMISFNFNKSKQTGIKEIVCGDKVIVEAVV